MKVLEEEKNLTNKGGEVLKKSRENLGEPKSLDTNKKKRRRDIEETGQ